jgi:putative phage-type endonuclease
LDIIRGGTATAPKSKAPKDAWYFLDANKNDHGPLPAQKVSENAGLDAFYVWREGMSDWVVNLQCQEFLALCQSQPPVKQPTKTFESTKSMSELVGLCRGLIADEKITTAEVMFLNSWLQDVGFIAEWPASEIAGMLERILEDGVVTKAEKEELKRLLLQIAAAPNSAAAQESPAAVSDAPAVLIAPLQFPHFTLVKHEQGTPEWLKWRHNGMGASDAPVVMGENPWKTADELLREKRGPARESFQNAAMARGTLLEPEARRLYTSRTGRSVHAACLQSSKYAWLRASVDGITAEGDSVVEIKCGESVYRKTSQYGCAPDYYYGQLQHILAVTGLQSIDFWCYLPGLPELLVPVQRDEKYIEELLKAEFEFWKDVQRGA